MSTFYLPNPNSNYSPQSIFNPAHQALLNYIHDLDEEEPRARRRVQRQAPDLLNMIFGDVA